MSVWNLIEKKAQACCFDFNLGPYHRPPGPPPWRKGPHPDLFFFFKGKTARIELSGSCVKRHTEENKRKREKKKETTKYSPAWGNLFCSSDKASSASSA